MLKILCFMGLHWFTFHHRRGTNMYYTCRCGRRDVINLWQSKDSPVDEDWLLGKTNGKTKKANPTQLI